MNEESRSLGEKQDCFLTQCMYTFKSMFKAMYLSIYLFLSIYLSIHLSTMYLSFFFLSTTPISIPLLLNQSIYLFFTRYPG